MLIFTCYDRRLDAFPEQAEMLRLWDLSWSQYGWESRVVPVDFAFKPGRAFRLPEYELRCRRAKVFAPYWLMNLGSRPSKWSRAPGVRVVKPDGAFIIAVKTLAEAEQVLASRK